ncbi:MAG: glycosyltransferase [Ardenticatenales bacterium]|nr:glycosyltransferase [Ardenticatenales bacterium]
MSKPKIAIVVQRYGEEVNGGAEQMARWVAERLTALAEVHVITTCAIDYQTWADHYPAGSSQLNGVQLHRFPVDQPRDWQAAQASTYQVFNLPHTEAEETAWLKEQGPYASGLFDYIRAQRDAFELFFFFTYIYAPAGFGLPLVADKAVFVPCAHDEPALYLPIFRPLFHQCRFIAYNTSSEKALVERVMGNAHVPNLVIGTGVDQPMGADPAQFRETYNLDGPYILYAGRIAPSKNVPELLDHFQRFRRETGTDVKLVLLGRANIPLPADPAIVATGFVSEEMKYAAIAGAELVVVPSRFESLSIITLEGWLLDRPVLVNGQCQVLLDLARQSQGGLFYTSYAEFKLTLSRLLSDAAVRQTLGSSGHAFADANFSWPVVLAKYEALLNILTPAHH